MASIDLEKLLEPIPGGAPCGANLEYDAQFLALERLGTGRPEQQMGDSIRPAEPPDYEAVVREATSLLGRSKDLRIAVQLARALSYLEGFQGLRDGLALVSGLFERYLATLYPELDPTEGNDPTMRVTAVAGLAAPGLLAALRSRPLIVSRAFGPISLRDLAIAAGNLPTASEGSKLDSAGIDAAFQDSDLAAHQAAARTVKAAIAHLRDIEVVFEREHAGQGPQLAALAELLRQAEHAIVSRLERRVPRVAPPSELSAPSGALASIGELPSADPTRPAASNGAIRTRGDVLSAIDKICEYYAEFEPSSPVPLLLQRGRRLVSKSFLDIMRDMAPDGVSQVESIAGKADA